MALRAQVFGCVNSFHVSGLFCKGHSHRHSHRCAMRSEPPPPFLPSRAAQATAASPRASSATRTLRRASWQPFTLRVKPALSRVVSARRADGRSSRRRTTSTSPLSRPLNLTLDPHPLPSALGLPCCCAKMGSCTDAPFRPHQAVCICASRQRDRHRLCLRAPFCDPYSPSTPPQLTQSRKTTTLRPPHQVLTSRWLARLRASL